MDAPADDVLARICAATRAEVARRKAATPQAAITAAARAVPPARGFAAALDRTVAEGRFALIAEIKKASPSGGLIRPEFDPPALAGAYRDGGATCLSVLTDGPHFQGEAAHLIAAREAVAMPVIRKDFIVDAWQVAESRAMGADCILLIMAALDDTEAAAFEAEAFALGMDVLAEVHDRAELERALRLKTRLVGINNRNLKTLKTDIATTVELAPLVPGDRVVVGESGLRVHADSQRLAAVGVRRFLVGESLMRQDDVAGATRALLGFTHFDASGNAVMVDVGGKAETARAATAKAVVAMRAETAAMIRSGTATKGDVLGVARIAGIMAAKRTAELIPLCHPLPITSVSVDLVAEADAVAITATVKTTGRTGVEMEALTAASVAALTVYDMCKSVDRGMRIEGLRVVEKSGGRSGRFRQD